MNYKLIENILRIYSKHKIKLIQMYGAAEATSRMSYLKWKYAKKKIGSIGKAISGVLALIGNYLTEYVRIRIPQMIPLS